MLAHRAKEDTRERTFGAIGLWFFGVAVLCELLAYPYGQRNDTLSQNVIVSLSAKAAQAAKDSQTAISNSATVESIATDAEAKAGKAEKESGEAGARIAALGKRATQIDQSLSMAQYFLSDREIRDPDELRVKLAKFSGKTIFFRSYVNDGDGYFVCKQLDWLAASAGVVATDQCGLFPVEPPHPMTQVNVFAPDDDTMLSLELIMAGATAFGASSGPVGNAPHASAIIVFVGRKNRAFVGETAQTLDAEKRAAAMAHSKRKSAP